MPKIVDHQQRRQELLDAMARVIVRAGIEGATTRAIAKESGWSTGSLAHYFSDRDDILSSVLRYSHERIKTRWAEKLADLHGLAALRELILDNVPLDEERRAETRLEMVFWSQALNSAELLRIQQTEAADLYDNVRRVVEEAQAAGEIAAAVPADEATERILALIDGFSLHALLYERRLTNDMIVRMIDTELELLRVGYPEPAEH